MTAGESSFLISVVIPIYKETAATLARLYSWMDKENSPYLEWILVGANDDETTLLSQSTPSFAKIITTNKGRSSQMNAGAGQSNGQFLLFLHADTLLSPGWQDEIGKAVKLRKRAWGYFEPKIDGRGLLLRIAEQWGIWRSRLLGLPYGDQAIFVDSITFKQLKGFGEHVQFMEDVDFVSRIKRLGLQPIALRSVAITSARNWQNGEALLYSSKNLIAILLHLLGIPRVLIRNWYYRNHGSY